LRQAWYQRELRLRGGEGERVKLGRYGAEVLASRYQDEARLRALQLADHNTAEGQWLLDGSHSDRA
jgi:hypothetical protein